MTKAVVVFFIAFSFFSRSVAQDKIFTINSGDLMKQGLEYHDKDEFKKAIKEYEQIPENDTNYHWALYELALSARADSQYALCKQTLLHALTLLPSEYEHDDYILLCSVLDDENKFDSAAVVVRKGIELFPNSFRMLHTSAVNCYLAGKMDSAVAIFERVLLMNPYAYNTHYMMGYIAEHKGYPIQAMLSYTMSLLLSPTGTRSQQALNGLYQLSNLSDAVVDSFTNRKAQSYFKEDYTDLEVYFKSKIALEKKYKIQTSLDETLFRQLNLVCDKITESQNLNEFWGSYYVPIYRYLFTHNQFEAMTVRMVAGVQSADVQKLVKSHEKEIGNMGTKVADYLNEIGYQHTLDKTKRTDDIGTIFEDNVPVAKGKLVNNDKKNLQGEWTFFNGFGDPLHINNYKNGVLQGITKSYYYTGVLKEEGVWENGKLNGHASEYYSNGLMKTNGVYVNSKKENNYTEYYNNGSKALEETYKNGDRNGPSTIYYESGSPHYQINYVDNEVDGLVKEFYKDGNVYSTVMLKKGKSNGEMTIYHRNGNVATKGQMVNGERDGDFINYDDNNKLSSKEKYSKGKLDGSQIYYYPNGLESSVTNYDKGDKEGISTDKDEEGRIECITEYKKGHIKKINFYNVLTNQIVSSSEMDDKQKNLLKLYNTTGNLSKEVVCDRDGIFNGEYKSYYYNGKLKNVVEYVKGNQEGKMISYFSNGKVNTDYNYDAGEMDGRYKRFFSNGILAEEGEYTKGKRQGFWYTYNNIGNLIDKEYYLNDEMHGPQYYYWGNGKINKKEVFDKGLETQIIQFDTAGNITLDHKIKFGEPNTITEKNPIGKIARTYTFTRNYLQGKHTNFYPNNSPMAVSYFKNGLKDSTYISYHANGKIKTTGQYAMNEKTGTWKNESRAGETESINHYRQDESEGTDTLFTQHHHIDLSIPYKNDERHGWLCKYAATGELIYKFHYIHGLLIGYTYEKSDGTMMPEIPVENSGKLVTIKTYFKNGKVSSECTYQNGDYEGKRTLYYPDGKEYYTSNYIDGERSGEEKEFYPNGQLYYCNHYLLGESHGSQKMYNEKGILIQDITYQNGYEHGISSYYDDNGKLQQKVPNYWGWELSVE